MKTFATATLMVTLLAALGVGVMMTSGCESSGDIEATAGDPDVKMQTHCPVMTGSRINRDLYVDHDGKRIFVCCNPCIDTVKENPAQYIKQLEDQGIIMFEPASAGHVHGPGCNH